MTIHFQDRSGKASLRCKNRAQIRVAFVNRSPIRYGFCVGARAIRYSVDIASTRLQAWFDPELRWNKSGYGWIDEISLSPDDVWVPDTVLLNT